MRELKVQIGNSGQRAYRVFPGIFRTYKTMTLRTIKSALVFGVAIFYSFVVFNAFRPFREGAPID
jgi:hypothetical protein